MTTKQEAQVRRWEIVYTTDTADERTLEFRDAYGEVCAITRWKDLDLLRIEETFEGGHFYLNRQTAAELAKILTRFAETGKL